jgi:hypothetical protein
MLKRSPSSPDRETNLHCHTLTIAGISRRFEIIAQGQKISATVFMRYRDATLALG